MATNPASQDMFSGSAMAASLKIHSRGDIILYDWGSDGIGHHTGIFVKRVEDSKTSFLVCEGNTEVGNNSDGGKVMLRNRKRSLGKGLRNP